MCMETIYKNDDILIFQNRFYDLDTGLLRSPVETKQYIIVQVAESYYGNRFQIEEHQQYCDLEITFPLTNGLSCAVNGVWEKVPKNESYLSFQGDIHALFSRKNCRFQTIAVNMKDGPGRMLLQEIEKRFVEQRTGHTADVSPLLTAILAEFMPPELPFSAAYLDSLITAVLVRLARTGMDKRTVDLRTAEETLPAIVNYIDAHFLDLCSLDELAATFGYTYSHICKVFKKTYGMTPGDYFRTKKLETAAALLKQGESVGTVADRLGYSTLYNFSRAFKKYYGVSPARFLPSK